MQGEKQHTDKRGIEKQMKTCGNGSVDDYNYISYFKLSSTCKHIEKKRYHTIINLQLL